MVRMPGYGSCFWADRTSARQRPTYKSFRGTDTADVVIIGGGLTGCAAAHVLAGAGYDVVLLEAERLGGGSTAGSLGAILPEPDASFLSVEATLGRGVARNAWKESRRAALDLAAALRKLPAKRELAPSDLVLASRTPDEVAELRREQAVRKKAGLDAPVLPARAIERELGTDAEMAFRSRGGFVFDPVRAALAMARAAAGAGARVFERSPVTRTRFNRKAATVVLERGRIETELVFVATGEPGRLFSQLRRHVRRLEGYAVATAPLTAEMRRQAGRREAVVCEPGEDPRWLRWLPQDRALFAGMPGKPLSARQPRQRERRRVQRAGELMYEFSVRYPAISGLPADWAWDFPVVATPDGLPWIGPHRNYPFHFFALAFGWHGDALAWWAARAALRALRGQSRKEDDTFGFARYLGGRS
jgi:glycine/D-amino acid oxidase-like deaminating enzyme